MLKKSTILYGLSLQPVIWILLAFAVHYVSVISQEAQQYVLSMGAEFEIKTGLFSLKYLFMQIFVVNALISYTISKYKGLFSLSLLTLDFMRLALTALPIYDLKLRFLYYDIGIHNAAYYLELSLLLGAVTFGIARYLHYSDTIHIRYFESFYFFNRRIAKKQAAIDRRTEEILGDSTDFPKVKAYVL